MFKKFVQGEKLSEIEVLEVQKICQGDFHSILTNQFVTHPETKVIAKVNSKSRVLSKKS